MPVIDYLNTKTDSLFTYVDDSVQSCKDIALVSSEKIPLGDVQIVRTATLDELREQITTLPLAADLPIPTIQFMRLWLLENEKKVKLLRGGYQTLQYVFYLYCY